METTQGHTHHAKEEGQLHNACRVCGEPGITTLPCDCALCELHDNSLSDAAPQMLDALKACVLRLETIDGKLNPVGLQNARAAIAKAEGRA